MQLKLSSQERWPCLNRRFLRKKESKYQSIKQMQFYANHHSFPHFGDFTRNTVGSIKNIINECIAERFNTLKINPTVQDSHGHPEDVPQNVHLHTGRYVPQIVSFENSQKWSLQTMRETTPKCHSRPKWSEKTRFYM